MLIVLIRRVRRSGVNAENINWIESGGTYWHMVDLLWVMLFAMIYLLPPGGAA